MVNLDLPPEQRWQQIGKERSAQVTALSCVITTVHIAWLYILLFCIYHLHYSLSSVTSCWLTLSPPILFRVYTLPYWSNPPFLIFDIRALWCSFVSARVPECQKLKMVGETSMALNPSNNSNLEQLALKGLSSIRPIDYAVWGALQQCV